MISWKVWFLAARPQTLPAAIVPVWAGCVLAWKLEGAWSLFLAVVTVLGAMFIQIATNFFNDVIDADKGADTEKRLGPPRVTASGLISRGAVIKGAVFMLVLAGICGFFLWQERGFWILMIGVPSLYLSYGYTGGPFPLAYRGLGEVFVILFFGFVAVGGTVFVQLGRVPLAAWILGLQIGLLSAVLIAINNYRDLEEDRAAGKNTITVRFGRSLVKRLVVTMTFVPYPMIILITLLAPEINGVYWGLAALLPMGLFSWLIWRGLEGGGEASEPDSQLLGLAALHLIVFVSIQTLVMALT